MKIIFLDIDGVCNCCDTKERFHGLIGVDPILVARIKEIVDATGAEIVLSSTWRGAGEIEIKENWTVRLFPKLNILNNSLKTTDSVLSVTLLMSLTDIEEERFSYGWTTVTNKLIHMQ